MSQEDPTLTPDPEEVDDDALSAVIERQHEILGALDELDARIEAVNRKLNNRISENGARSSGSSKYGGGVDGRDAAVLDTLEPGERVQKETLAELYLRTTDISTQSTAESRAESLHKKTDTLVHENFGRFRFVGQQEP